MYKAYNAETDETKYVALIDDVDFDTWQIECVCPHCGKSSFMFCETHDTCAWCEHSPEQLEPKYYEGSVK